MMRILTMSALALCAACCAPPEVKKDDKITAQEAKIEALETQIQRLRREKASGTVCGAALSDILYRVEQGKDSQKVHNHVDSRPVELDTVAKENQVSPELFETFGTLTDMIGKCYRGVPSNNSTERQADFQRWSWALGGKAILIRHALEDGSYGGDTYIYKDSSSDELVYVYITNAGFRTEGKIELSGDSGYIAEEAVIGHPTISKVRSTSTRQSNGSIEVVSELFDDGEWVTGHDFTYTQTNIPPALK